MKIRLTERQINLIGSLSEDGPKITRNHTKDEISADYNRLVEFSSGFKKQLDKYFNLITANSIGEILYNENIQAKIKKYYQSIEGLYNQGVNLYNIINDKVEEMPDEDIFTWGDDIMSKGYHVFNEMEDKKDALENLVDLINDMVMGFDDANVKKWFSNSNFDMEI